MRIKHLSLSVKVDRTTIDGYKITNQFCLPIVKRTQWLVKFSKIKIPYVFMKSDVFKVCGIFLFSSWALGTK